MKRLNDAIAYFEDAVRESDESIQDSSPALQTMLRVQKEHFIVALAAMNSMRWIPVSERMPDDNERVLISDGRSVCEGYGESVRLHPKIVTHWMPLPEPPGAEPTP